MSGFKRLSLTSCALLLSLSTVANADESLNQPVQSEREKAYTLTRVDAAGENTITKIELNTDTGKFEPVYYRLDLTKTEYGEGDTTRYFEWTKTEDGHTFGEVSTPTEGKTTITVHYDNTTSERIGNTSAYEKGSIISNFISQEAGFDISGGAIANENDINLIKGDFIENSTDEASGGAIFNTGNIESIEGNFVGNISQYYTASVPDYGGTITNRGYIGNITGNFINNSALGAVKGGAIYNESNGTIETITGDFIGNSSASYGGGIYNNGTIGNITGGFIGNKSGDGGAIFNYGASIGNIEGDFIQNYANNNGGAIYNCEGKIGDITGDFIENSAKNGGAIYNAAGYLGDTTLGNITGDFIGNHAEINGGAIYNYKGYAANITLGNFQGNFLNNYVKTSTDTEIALGGAIYTNDDINLLADGKTHYISGNYTEDPTRGKVENAIFVDTYNANQTLSFTVQNGGKYIIDDQIEGGSVSGTTIDYTDKYNLKITGDKTGAVVLNNSVINADTTLDEVTLHLTKADILETSTLTANSGHLSLINGLAETQSMQSMAVNGHLGMSVDVDLQAAKMDRLPEGTVVNDGAKIDVEHLNLLNDASKDKTDILFAEESYKDKVSYTGANPVAYSPIYKYDVSYNEDDGFFTFLRSGGASGNPSESFNPTVLAPSVAAQAGAYATQMNTFNYAFQHSDNFMNLPFMERLALKESGRYASTATNSFSPLYTRIESAGYWVKPYVSFESIPLKNGPKVDNINYGSLIGYDSKITPIAHGFDRVLSGYVGYNGASQSYSGVDSYQNGGLVGGTIFLYKGNFFNATTLSVGASVGESQNMYGNENYTMLLAGIGNRLGYNFEFKQGRYIIQPSMLMSYTFVNTFDYTNAAGVRMESDPLHAIQLAPGVKFIMNTKNGWQPYAAVNMAWNVLDKTDVRANDVRLPEMSIKPYVQYGLGIQKKIKDRFLAFGQAMYSNGGRNGVSLSFGLRWFLGGGEID